MLFSPEALLPISSEGIPSAAGGVICVVSGCALNPATCASEPGTLGFNGRVLSSTCAINVDSSSSPPTVGARFIAPSSSICSTIGARFIAPSSSICSTVGARFIAPVSPAWVGVGSRRIGAVEATTRNEVFFPKRTVACSPIIACSTASAFTVTTPACACRWIDQPRSLHISQAWKRETPASSLITTSLLASLPIVTTSLSRGKTWSFSGPARNCIEPNPCSISSVLKCHLRI